VNFIAFALVTAVVIVCEFINDIGGGFRGK